MSDTDPKPPPTFFPQEYRLLREGDLFYDFRRNEVRHCNRNQGPDEEPMWVMTYSVHLQDGGSADV